MKDDYAWDARKCATNIAKRGIDFDDAIQIFDGPHCEFSSPRNEEARYVAIGEVEGVIVAVVYTLRDDTRRIISARRARKNEERDYY
ncbi:MAG: BrnT family toxin [Rhodospirillaceae bacterium]|nr:BrnT family toxin [Rhodospirillaceae bacterium]